MVFQVVPPRGGEDNEKLPSTGGRRWEGWEKNELKLSTYEEEIVPST